MVTLLCGAFLGAWAMWVVGRNDCQYYRARIARMERDLIAARTQHDDLIRAVAACHTPEPMED